MIGYARVSTEDQGLRGVSLATQKAAIRAECQRRGWTLLRVEEDVVSGRTMKRPGLQAALDSCRSGEAGGIVASKLDRLSRSVIDFARLLEEAQKREFNVVALDLGLDLSTPHGELVAHIIASTAQWERRVIGERTREALAARRSEGVRLGRPVTLPRTVERRIERERSRGMSLAAIAERLNRDGVPTAQGGKKWYAATVRHVLHRIAR